MGRDPVIAPPRGRVYRLVHSSGCNMCGAGVQDQHWFGRRLDVRQGFRPRGKGGLSVSIFRCGVCGLLYANPMPIPGSLEQHYDVAPEAYWPEGSLALGDGYLDGEIRTFRRLTGRDPAGCTALDVGAGIGRAMRVLAEAGFEVQGIEPSPAFRDAALQRHGIPPYRLQLGSIEEAEYPAESFDFINFGAVLEHLPDPSAALARAVRWLRPDGLLYVQVPSARFLLSRLVRCWYRVTGVGEYVINTCPLHPPYHFYEFTSESFRLNGLSAGYRIVFEETHPCAGYVPTWLIPPLNALMQATGTGMQLAVWLRAGSPD